MRLHAEAGSEWPVVQGSEPELTRVVRNLLSNAIRHTPPEGTVVVAAGARDGQAWLRVTVMLSSMIAALIGLGFKNILYRIDDLCDRVWRGRPPWARPAVGGIVDHLAGPAAGQPALYAVVGTRAVFASAARGPLTSLASVVEMTGDFSLTLPIRHRPAQPPPRVLRAHRRRGDASLHHPAGHHRSRCRQHQRG